MHLRLLDDDRGGPVSPLGGFTIAYRVTANGDRFTASYAYAECSSMDNYCRAVGRRIATARLDGPALEFSGSFAIDLPAEVDRGAALYKLDDFGTIDIAESAFALRPAVLRYFWAMHLSALYRTDLDLDLDLDLDFGSAVVWRGHLPYLNMEVLSAWCEPKDPVDTLVKIHELAEKLQRHSKAFAVDFEARSLVSEITALSSGWTDQ